VITGENPSTDHARALHFAWVSLTSSVEFKRFRCESLVRCWHASGKNKKIEMCFSYFVALRMSPPCVNSWRRIYWCSPFPSTGKRFRRNSSNRWVTTRCGSSLWTSGAERCGAYPRDPRLTALASFARLRTSRWESQDYPVETPRKLAITRSKSQCLLAMR